MQQNDAAPFFFLAHGPNKNYVLSVSVRAKALTFFHLLQLIGYQTHPTPDVI